MKLVIMVTTISSIVVCTVACVHSRLTANYKVTPQGYTIWRYSKPGEPKLDILSSGDTLVSTVDTVFIRHKKQQ